MIAPGMGSGLHQDAPFLKGPPPSAVISVWTPLGDIKPDEGALVLLEGSNKSSILRREYGDRDVDAEPNFGWYDTDLEKTQARIGGVWLTEEFQAGDVLCFDLFTLHGAFDNNSPECAVRLSSDSRFQSTEFPVLPRWEGSDPTGRSKGRIFLPMVTTADELDNTGLVTEFHDINDLGVIQDR